MRSIISAAITALFATVVVLGLSYRLHCPVYAAGPAEIHGMKGEAESGGQSSQDHYSPLAQITRSNVKKLVVAWKFDVGEAGNGMETNSLVVGDVLYTYTSSQKVIALNAATGKLLWTFDSGVDARQPIRGLAYWTNGRERRLLASVLNNLYALDPGTGKVIPSFGENGHIDLRKNLNGDYRQQSIVLTSPGVIYKDLIIVGGRNPETSPAPAGDIRAFDVNTGALRWRFKTIPHPDEVGYDTWPTNAWKTAGAANNWAGMTLDDRRGIIYVPTGSAVPDFYGGARVGNDLFADTLLALDANTGKVVWYFQGVHHDIWDRDFPSAPVLLTIQRNGKKVDVVAQTSKQGFLFVFDRDTGKPIFPIVERHVEGSTVPGEVTSKTQPFPVLPLPYARQSITENDLTTRTPEAHAWALQQFRMFVNGDQFTPLRLNKQTIVAPGFDGGAEWGGPAVDRTKGVIYINTNDIAWTGGLEINDLSAGLGRQTYESQCSVCHRDNRAGSPPDFPSLIQIDSRLTAEQIGNTIHQGKGRMPSFPNLQGTHLKLLLEYLRTGLDDSSAEAGKELSHQHLTPDVQDASKAPQLDSKGNHVYINNCAICHGEGMQGIAPSFPGLAGVGSRLSKQQITSLVRSGKGRMPAFTDARISNPDLDALLNYLRPKDLEVNDVETLPDDAMRYRFTGYQKFYDQDGYPAVKPPWGTLNAIDLNSGKYIWKVPLGNYPELASKGMETTGTENYGGPIVTAGGLVFIGATIFDNEFRAFDSSTGKLLWKAELPYAGLATPTTYAVDGRQYIVIAAGGGRNPKARLGGAYIAFALPKAQSPQ